MFSKFHRLKNQKGRGKLIGLFATALVCIFIVSFTIPLFVWLVCPILGLTHAFSDEVDKNYTRFATIPDKGVLGGVCSGFAYQTETPVWVWRVGTVVGVMFTDGLVALAYVAVWLFAPHRDGVPDDYAQKTH